MRVFKQGVSLRGDPLRVLAAAGVAVVRFAFAAFAVLAFGLSATILAFCCALLFCALAVVTTTAVLFITWHDGEGKEIRGTG